MRSRPTHSRLLLAAATSLAAALLATTATPQGACPPGSGQALQFDGIDDRVNCGNAWPLENHPHTIEAWVYISPDHGAGSKMIAGQWGLRCWGRGFTLYFNQDQGVTYFLDLPGGGGVGGWVTDPSPVIGAWQHYAGTWDGSMIRLHRDGQLIGSLAYSSGYGAFTVFSIGAWAQQCGATPPWVGHFVGSIDEVRVWDHARSPQEIAGTMNRCLTGGEPGLVGYWPLDEGGGPTTADLSPGGHDGSISGATWVEQTGCFAGYCFGDASCPCGNADPGAGCTNSTGVGAQLDGRGSSSVASDDLALVVSQVPANQNGILFMGRGRRCGTAFGAGVLCVGPGAASFCRFPIRNAGPGGMLAEGPGIVAHTQTLAPDCRIEVGDTWYFQGWYRDPSGPCGATFNLSNAYAVSFVP